MTWWYVPGQGVVNDQEEGARIPLYGEMRMPDGSLVTWGDQGVHALPTYSNRWQYGKQDAQFQWDPIHQPAFRPRASDGGGPGAYGGYLLGLADRVERGQATPDEQDEYQRMRAAALAVPMRDLSQLSGEYRFRREGDEATTLDPSSPDLGAILLTLRDKQRQGTATPAERALYADYLGHERWQDWQANVPQASDANPFGMGDNLMGALMMLGMGATGGTAAGALAAGGLTLGSAAGLAGTAGSMAGMMGEATDQDWLRKAGIALGAAGGLAGAGSALSGGLSSLGDVVTFAKGLYGAGSKALGLAQGAGSTPETPAVGSRSQTLGAGGSSTEGGGMAGILESLGPLLGAAIGAVGTGMSLDDVSRYMDQLKARFGQQEETKRLIDEAYKLAVARYETFYARNQEEYGQKQAAYQAQLATYQTHYGDTRLQQEQQQIQYAKDSGQIDEDRARQLTTWAENRRNDLANYEERRSQALEDRGYEQGIFADDRTRALTDYDRRVGQSLDERGLDLNAYQQRQAVARSLSDPATIAAGAKDIYEPLSAAARDRINTQTEEEMARRGVAGGGQFSTLMAAKAFAPLEQQMWQNALQGYLTGQQGAANAYTQQDLTMSPEYKYASVPDFGRSPDYNLGAPPAFLRAGAVPVPGAVAPPATYPGAPTQDWNALRFQPNVPGANQYYAEPYAPWGTSAQTGGGAGGPLANAGALAQQLGKLLGGNTGLIQQVMKLFGGGGTTVPASFLAGGGDETQQPWYDPAYMEGPFNWQGSESDLVNFDPWEGVDMSAYDW